MAYVNPEYLHLMNPIVGALLRIKRKEKNLSERELGEHLNLSWLEIKQSEAGERTLTVPEIYAASEALGVSSEYFFLPFRKPELFKETSPENKTNNVIVLF